MPTYSNGATTESDAAPKLWWVDDWARLNENGDTSGALRLAIELACLAQGASRIVFGRDAVARMLAAGTASISGVRDEVERLAPVEDEWVLRRACEMWRFVGHTGEELALAKSTLARTDDPEVREACLDVIGEWQS